ncbi:hypothetical protein CK203_061427 [Vitis vinifera]|uniref:Uncharacterized protein n=1 Tax=Vitis vinifera TaxID=29760 RepID=A0A438GFA5_VITVI|nr:hypothetical protein CK203_061427 [Vitis vinifera]
MARTRGAKSSSPSNRKKSLRKEPSPGSAPKASPSRPIPPPVKPVPPKPPTRRYLTRSGGWPLQKKPRVESSEPIDLTEQSPGPSPIPSPVQTPVPSPSSPASSIAGYHLRCRKKNLRSLKCHFPSPKFKRKHLWKNIQSEARACPIIPAAEEVSYGATASSKRLFLSSDSHGFLPVHDNQKVRNPTLIHFTIDGRHRILGARHIAEALQIPFEPTQFDNFRAWANPTELEMPFSILKRGSQEEASESRLHSPPLPKAAMPNLEHLGYPAEPQLERKRICREPFTLDKWNNMTAYKVDQPGQPQPAARRASPRHIPEASQSNLAQEMAAIKACQEQMLASQAQQAAILRQLQIHFDLPQAVEPSISTPPEPHSQPTESHPPEPEAPADPPTEEADPSA